MVKEKQTKYLKIQDGACVDLEENHQQDDDPVGWFGSPIGAVSSTDSSTSFSIANNSGLKEDDFFKLSEIGDLELQSSNDEVHRIQQASCQSNLKILTSIIMMTLPTIVNLCMDEFVD